MSSSPACTKEGVDFGSQAEASTAMAPRALIARSDRYEPAVNRLVGEFRDPYDVAVPPARPAHPRDKPTVEVGVDPPFANNANKGNASTQKYKGCVCCECLQMGL